MKQLKEKEFEEFQQYLYNKAHGYIWTPDTPVSYTHLSARTAGVRFSRSPSGRKNDSAVTSAGTNGGTAISTK